MSTKRSASGPPAPASKKAKAESPGLSLLGDAYQKDAAIAAIRAEYQAGQVLYPFWWSRARGTGASPARCEPRGGASRSARVLPMAGAWQGQGGCAAALPTI